MKSKGSTLELHLKLYFLSVGEVDGIPSAARPEIGVVAGKVFGNRPQTRLRRQQMDLLGELRFELVLLIHVEIRVFYGVQNPICDLRVVKVKDLLSAVLVIQRDSRAVLHGSLEVIDRNIAAKGASRTVY